VEKAKADVERTKRLFNGIEGLRSEMSVIDELLGFWNVSIEGLGYGIEGLGFSPSSLYFRGFGVWWLR
jgi:hypothetical protein